MSHPTRAGIDESAAKRTDVATVRSEDPVDGVRVLTIDRRHRRNALDHATYLALVAALEDTDADPDIRAIVLTGAGDTFTSGNDIADFRQQGPRGGPLLFSALIKLRKPVIAAVEGHAVGIGVTLLLHCDLAFAGETAQFRLPFTALGLCPEGGSSYLLPRLAGEKRANEMLLLGERFTAAEAAAAGLINRAVASGDALEDAVRAAETLAQRPTASVLATKALIRAHRDPTVSAALAAELEVFAERLADEATQAILSAPRS